MLQQHYNKMQALDRCLGEATNDENALTTALALLPATVASLDAQQYNEVLTRIAAIDDDGTVAAQDFQADRPRSMLSAAAGPDGVRQLRESSQGGKITGGDAHPHSDFRSDQNVQPGSYFSRQFFDVRQCVRH